MKTTRKTTAYTTPKLVREALRTHFNGRFPIERATKAELAAIRRGQEAIRRGEYVTLEELHRELESDRRKASKKVSQKNS